MCAGCLCLQLGSLHGTRGLSESILSALCSTCIGGDPNRTRSIEHATSEQTHPCGQRNPFYALGPPLRSVVLSIICYHFSATSPTRPFGCIRRDPKAPDNKREPVAHQTEENGSRQGPHRPAYGDTPMRTSCPPYTGADGCRPAKPTGAPGRMSLDNCMLQCSLWQAVTTL